MGEPYEKTRRRVAPRGLGFKDIGFAPDWISRRREKEKNTPISGLSTTVAVVGGWSYGGYHGAGSLVPLRRPGGSLAGGNRLLGDSRIFPTTIKSDRPWVTAGRHEQNTATNEGRRPKKNCGNSSSGIFASPKMQYQIRKRFVDRHTGSKRSQGL